MLYLGRRVYYGVVIVLVMAMSQGLTPRRVTRLRAAIGVSRQMLSRWREWWRERYRGHTKVHKPIRHDVSGPFGDLAASISACTQFRSDVSEAHLLGNDEVTRATPVLVVMN